MSFATDIANAELAREVEEANASLSKAECLTRYLRRRLYAEGQTAGTSTNAFQNLAGMGAPNPSAVMDDASFASTRATFETALAQLVTDAGSPTQAHVTTANTAWLAYLPHLNVRHRVLADQATFAAALAVLVADGASPTQNHVTSSNNAYTTLSGGVV